MRVLIVGILLLTLGVAAVSTYLIQRFQTPEALEQLEREKQAPRKFVLVAVKDLTVGMTVKADDLAWQVWVDDAMRPEYTVRTEPSTKEDEAKLMEAAIGAVVRRTIVAGEPLVGGKLFRPERSSLLAGLLSPGMRAASIKVTDESSAAGFIFPGDRVDVILTHNMAVQVVDTEQAKTGEMEVPILGWTGETIIADRLVLSIGQEAGELPPDAKAQVVPVITIEVTPKEAEIINVAKSMGRLSLSLRSMTDLESEGEGEAEEVKPGFTTDVEVSPFLSSRIKRTDKDEEAEIEMLKAMIEAISGEGKAAGVEKRPTRSAPPPPLVIYRGKSGTAEEVAR